MSNHAEHHDDGDAGSRLLSMHPQFRYNIWYVWVNTSLRLRCQVTCFVQPPQQTSAFAAVGVLLKVWRYNCQGRNCRRCAPPEFLHQRYPAGGGGVQGAPGAPEGLWLFSISRRTGHETAVQARYGTPRHNGWSGDTGIIVPADGTRRHTNLYWAPKKV